MKKILLLTSYMSGHGGVEKVIERMYRLEQQLNVAFYTISLTDGNYIDKDGKENILATNSTQWIPKGKGRFLRINLKNKTLNFILHVIYVFIFILCNRIDGVIATGPIQPWYLNFMRKILRKKFFIFGWPHFSATSGFGDFKRFSFADKILCISLGIIRQMEDIGFPTNKLEYFPNPFDKIKLDVSFFNKKADEPKTFLYIGRFQFNKQKNIKELIDAASLVAGDFRISLIGDGEDYDKIIEYISEKQLTSKFEINRGWKDEPWKSIDFRPAALVLTSSFEGLPTVLGEALSRGVPCISSSCETGPTDFIKEKLNGYIYEAGNPIALANIMQSFVDDKISFSPEIIQESMNGMYIHSYILRFNKIMDEVNG
ncbi:glycosyltransferase [Klebsiella oxytoca]